MEKTLFFAILAFSISVSAQIKQPTSLNQLQTNQLPAPQHFSTIQIVDSVKNWEWDAQSYGWKNKSKNTNMIYNSNNNLTSYITQTWNGSSWENTGQFAYTYDASNNMTSETKQNWNSGNWQNTGKYTYTYDVSNNQTSYLYQNWYNGHWQNSGQYIYTYNASNNVTSKLYQSWDGNAWVNSSQESYTYDNSNNLTIHLFQVWVSNNLVNSMKYSYTYDGYNNQTSYLYQNWNNGWENFQKYNYTYDANNNQTSNLYQVWNVTTWENQWKYSYTYDANNNRTIALKMNWIGSWLNYIQQIFTYDTGNNKASELDQDWVGTVWRDHWRYYYAYDANNNLTSIITQNTDGSGQWNCYDQTTNTYVVDTFMLSHQLLYWSSDCNVILGGDSTYNYYHTEITGINDLLAQGKGIVVYPNPSSDKITIVTPSQGHISVITLTGQQLIQEEITKPATTFDISGLKSGVYLAKLIGEKGVQFGKFIKN